MSTPIDLLRMFKAFFNFIRFEWLKSVTLTHGTSYGYKRNTCCLN